MTEGIAIEIACRKMQEIKAGKGFLLRYRHFQLQPSGSLVIKANSDLMILLIPDGDTRVSSKTGIYDLKDAGVLEMQYLHTGNVAIENLNKTLPIQVKFLQVIPPLKPHNDG
jgi:hypothetical protein